MSFVVKSIEKLKEPEFTNNMSFRLLSPIHVIRKNPFHPDKTDHLSPEHKEFDQRFLDNLINKYNAYHEPKEFDTVNFKFELLSEPRQKLVHIRTGTPQATKLKSYLFDFKLQADPELIRIGYYAGFGKANSQGFGCGEVKMN